MVLDRRAERDSVAHYLHLEARFRMPLTRVLEGMRALRKAEAVAAPGSTVQKSITEDLDCIVRMVEMEMRSRARPAR